jgi:hypothetical protein
MTTKSAKSTKRQTKKRLPQLATSYKLPTAEHDYIKRHWAFLLIGTWVLLGILTGFVALRAHREAEKQSMVVKVIHTTYDKHGQEPFVPGTSYQFVIIDVKVSNNTSDMFNLAPVVQSYITDEQGTKYNMAPAIISRPLAAGRLANGVSTNGTLSYVVPLGVKHLTFHFVADSPQHIRYEHALPTPRD